MDKIKKIIIVLIILLIVTTLIILILLNIQKKDNINEEINNQERIYEETLKTTLESRFYKCK